MGGRRVVYATLNTKLEKLLLTFAKLPELETANVLLCSRSLDSEKW